MTTELLTMVHGTNFMFTAIPWGSHGQTRYCWM